MTIKVIGVGGCGVTIVNNVSQMGLENVQFAVVNNDAKPIDRVQFITEKVLVDKDDLQLESKLRTLCDGADVLAVVAGLGGKYSAEVAATLCRIHGQCSNAYVVLPFAFERREQKSMQDLELIRSVANTVSTFDNNTLSKYPDIPMQEAFRMTDQWLFEHISALR